MESIQNETLKNVKYDIRSPYFETEIEFNQVSFARRDSFGPFF
jgi:hypothetical protein